MKIKSFSGLVSLPGIISTSLAWPKIIVGTLVLLFFFTMSTKGQDKNSKEESHIDITGSIQSSSFKTAENNSVKLDAFYDFQDGIFPDNFFARTSGTHFDRTTSENTWYIDQSSDTYQSGFSMRSGSISHNENSNVAILVNIKPEGGSLQFKYRTSSEAEYDLLLITIGDSSYADSGVDDWADSREIDLPAGEYYIEFWYTKNGSAEDGLDAVFVDNISITGMVDSTSETPELISISDARNTANGEVVQVKGVVTRALGSNTSIQQNGAGLHIFSDSGSFFDAVGSGNVREGDSLLITGELADFNDLKELIEISDFSVTSRNNPLPDPVELNLSQINEQHESVLVQVYDLSTNHTGSSFENSTSYALLQNDAAQSPVLYIGSDNNTELGSVTIPSSFHFEGVVKQFSGDYQLVPVYSSDIIADEPPASALKITEITPNAAAPGTNVTIYGSDFSTSTSDNNVTFDGTSATVQSASENKLIVRVPNINSGFADVSVSNSSGSASYAGSFSILAKSTWNIFEGTDAGLEGVYNSSSDFGDINGDGHLDLIVTGYNNSVPTSTLYLNDGSGGFFNSEISLEAVYFSTSKFKDINGDGHLDLFISGYNSVSAPTSILYFNDGEGELYDSGVVIEGLVYSTSNFGDFNNDGYIDLIVTGYNNAARTSTLYFNDGNGGFTDSGIYLEGVDRGSTSVGDVNNDGHLDLVIAGYNSSAVPSTTLYFNDGDGGLYDSGATLEGTFWGSTNFGDVNGNGHLDLIITGYNSNSTPTSTLYFNDGNGGFTDSGLFLRGVLYSTSDFVDINGDGHLDLLITGRNNVSDRISTLYLNDGNGELNDSGISLEGVERGSTSFGDINGDGDLDLLITGYNSPNLPISRLYENIDVELVSISDARNLSNDELISINGVITSAMGEHSTIQQDEAGLHIYAPDGVFFDAVQNGDIVAGDSVTVIGTLDETNYRKEIREVISFNVTSRNNSLPTPLLVRLSEVGEEHESRLVRIFNISLNTTISAFQNGVTYGLIQLDALQSPQLFIANNINTELGGISVPGAFNFTGTITQNSLFNSTGGYQLRPVYESDIEEFVEVGLSISSSSINNGAILNFSDKIEIQFNQNLEDYSGLNSALQGALLFTNNKGLEKPIYNFTFENSLLRIDESALHALDTLRLSISNEKLIDNSIGGFYLDSNQNGNQDIFDDSYVSPEFFTTYIGDFDLDMRIDFDDLVEFSDGWRSNNTTFETAPIGFTDNLEFPHASLHRDGRFDIEDLITFIRFWNLSHARNDVQFKEQLADNASGKDALTQKNIQGPSSGDDTGSKTNKFPAKYSAQKSTHSDNLSYITYETEKSEVGYTDLNQPKQTTYTFSISHPDSVEAMELIIGYDPGELRIKSVNDYGVFNQTSKDQTFFISHNDSTNGVLTLNLANSGSLSPLEAREFAKITIERLEGGESDLTILSDIRTKGKPALLQSARKSVDMATEMPAEFNLFQNYPNPFNPTTSIHYEIAEQAQVELNVYDILGRKIETLINEKGVQPGFYKATWNASRYASGMYIYVLQVKSKSGQLYTNSRKMVLVK